MSGSHECAVVGEPHRARVLAIHQANTTAHRQAEDAARDLVKRQWQNLGQSMRRIDLYTQPDAIAFLAGQLDNFERERVRAEERADFKLARRQEFEGMLARTVAMKMDINVRLAARLGCAHPHVVQSDIINGFGQHIALARIVTDRAGGLPPGQFETSPGSAWVIDDAKAVGEAAAIIMPGWPHRPGDLIAIALDGSRVWFRGKPSPVLCTSTLIRDDTLPNPPPLRVHLHPAAWLAARAKAFMACGIVSGVADLIIAPREVDWTRGGYLGQFNAIEFVDADSARDSAALTAIYNKIPKRPAEKSKYWRTKTFGIRSVRHE